MMNSTKLWNRIDTIFMKSENSKISDLHRLLLNLLERIDWKKRDEYVTSWNLSICYSWKKIKKSCKSKKYKISALTWIEKFELPDVSYTVSDIQVYFNYIIKKTWNCYLQFSNKNICKSNTKRNNIWNIGRILSWTFNDWNGEITWKH